MNPSLFITVTAVLALLTVGCEDKSVTRGPVSSSALGALILESGPLFLSGVETRNGVFLAGGKGGPDGGRVYRLSDGLLSSMPILKGPTLWWIWQRNNILYACGEDSRVLRLDDDVWVDMSPIDDEKVTFWGGWTDAQGKVFVVGGSRDRFGPKALVYSMEPNRRDWDKAALAELVGSINFFKIWGDDAGQVFVVGEGGTIVRFRDGGVERMETPTRELLFTIHGNTNGEIFAVGGTRQGIVLQLVAGQWIKEEFDRPRLPFSGVFVKDDGRVVVVGERGQIVQRGPAGQWADLPVSGGSRGLQGYTLHAVFGHEQLYAVGGNFALGRGGVLVTQNPIPSLARSEVDEDAGAVPLDAHNDVSFDMTRPFDIGVDSGFGDDGSIVSDMSISDQRVSDAQEDGSVDQNAELQDGGFLDGGSVCGNGSVDEGETCDDGNVEDGDGCDSVCGLECGNGSIGGIETCDDGNRSEDDGCDSNCQLECGNRSLNGVEECDDGNRLSDDGCSTTCLLECGDGHITGAETCDDGGRLDGDGCSSDCILECGNGVLDGREECDDGNRIAGDGCDGGCVDERPRIGEICEELPCRGDLECLGVAEADFVPVCTLQCVDDGDCERAGFREDVVCDLIGPQLIDTYCVPTRCFDGEC